MQNYAVAIGKKTIDQALLKTKHKQKAKTQKKWTQAK
jgi:hypothetical protein